MASTGVRRRQWVPKSIADLPEGIASTHAAAKCARRWGDRRSSDPWTNDVQSRQDGGTGGTPSEDSKRWTAEIDAWKASKHDGWDSKPSCPVLLGHHGLFTETASKPFKKDDLAAKDMEDMGKDAEIARYAGDVSGCASGDDASGPGGPETSIASTSADSQGDADELPDLYNVWDKATKSGRNKIAVDEFTGKAADDLGNVAQPQEVHPEEVEDGVEAGRMLLSMLMEKVPEKDAAPRPEPQPLSTDEFQLWAMQAREDAEIGADVMNSETFGEDSGQGWSFEENLAANEQLTQQRYTEDLVQAQARAAAELASFYDYGQSCTYEEGMAVQAQRRTELVQEVERIDMAICKAASFLDLKPVYLNEAVRMIIYKGWADIAWRHQYTALHLAAELGHAAVMPLLVALCADPDNVDTKGRTALGVAESYSHWGCVMVLNRLRMKSKDEKWVCLPTALSEPAPSASAEASPQLCHRAAQRVAQASNGDLEKELRRMNAVLHEMARFLKIQPWCLQEAVQYMTGGYYSVQTRLPLHMAAEYGCDDVLFYLLLLRADPYAVDGQGRTALDVAACSTDWGCAEMLRLFLNGHSYADIAKWADCRGGPRSVMGYSPSVTHVRLREMPAPR